MFGDLEDETSYYSERTAYNFIFMPTILHAFIKYKLSILKFKVKKRKGTVLYSVTGQKIK